MPWVQIGAAIIGGLFSRSSRRSERRAQRDAQRLNDERLRLSRRQVELGERLFGDWERRFGPVSDALIAEAQREIRPDFEAIAADNAAAFESQRQQMGRRLQRFGISPDEGAFQDDMRRLGLAEAGSHVLARNEGRRGARQQRFGNLLAAYGVGSGLPSAAAGFMGAGSAGLGDARNFSADQADAFARRAADDAYGAGQFWTNAWAAVRGGAGQRSGTGAGWRAPYVPLRSPGPWRGTYGMPAPSPWSPRTPWSGP